MNNLLIRNIQRILFEQEEKKPTVAEYVDNMDEDVDIVEILDGNIKGPIYTFVVKHCDPVTIMVKKLCWRFQPMPPENLFRLPQLKQINGFDMIGKYTLYYITTTPRTILYF